MSKRAISLTLDNANLLWLQARAQQTQARSMSELVDQMLTNLRVGDGSMEVQLRSVVGLAKIIDPTLFEDAAEDANARGSRHLVTAVRETSTPYRARRKPRRG